MRHTTFSTRYYDVQVFVYRTRRGMERAARCIWPELPHDNFLARCGSTRNKPPLQPFPAVMLFCEEHFGAGVVSHEITHLMIDVWRHRKNGSLLLRRSREEETFATAIGDLNTAFWNWWYDKDDRARFRIEPLSAEQYRIRRVRKTN